MRNPAGQPVTDELKHQLRPRPPGNQMAVLLTWYRFIANSGAENIVVITDFKP